jgi:hypothetical protein
MLAIAVPAAVPGGHGRGLDELPFAALVPRASCVDLAHVAGACRVIVELVDDAGTRRNAPHREGRLLHALERCREGLHVGDLARHEELQRILGARIVAEIDEALINDLGACLRRDVAAEIDVELTRDLEVVRRPGASHGVVEVDAAATCDGDEGIGLRRLAVVLHMREVKPGERSHDLEVAQLLRADIHQQVLAGGIVAVEALDRILHRSGKLAVCATELLEQHVAESGIGRIDAHRVHELLDVVIHGGLLTPRRLGLSNRQRGLSVPGRRRQIWQVYSAACLVAVNPVGRASWMRLKVASAWPTTWSML